MAENTLSRAVDLHIGSGIFYRPNYINIDLYEMSVVDLGAHAAFLPFKDGSIKSIEANHLIEHFSWVEVKYLLNEWFRVLEKGGRLILEVPDLVESAKELKKLKNSEFQFQVAKIQWIFGIQEEGMQHKSGFTFSLLRSFLHIIGFVDVTKEKPITHTYEKGIKISCKKPSLSEKLSETILRKFRTELAMLYFFGDIKFISLLERIIIVEVEPLLTNNIIELHKKTLLKVITKLCLCYPLLATKFLSIPQLHPLIPKPYLENIIQVVTILKTSDYHQKLFTLWKLRKKSPGNMKSEFVNFMREMEQKILESIEDSSSLQIRFAYISSLSQQNIPFFDRYFILQHATLLFHQGIQCFTKSQYELAEECFTASLKLNPDNYLTYWNLGRIKNILGDESYKDEYLIAYKLVGEKPLKLRLNAELKKITNPTMRWEYFKPIISEER